MFHGWPDALRVIDPISGNASGLRPRRRGIRGVERPPACLPSKSPGELRPAWDGVCRGREPPRSGYRGL